MARDTSLTQPALLGGVFIGVLSALPIINVANCCCLWIIAGGVLTTHLLRQYAGGPVGVGPAAATAVKAAMVGAVVWLIVSALIDPIVAPIQQQMLDAALSDSRDLPPEVREIFDNMAAGTSAPARFIAGFVVQLVANLIFTTLGGVLAEMWWDGAVASHGGGSREG